MPCMDDANETWALTLPPFNAEAASVQMQRSLRDLGLTLRAGGFERQGRRAIEFTVNDGAIALRLARRLSLRTPDWDVFEVRSGADQRRFLDEVKRRLARWTDDD